jgi:DNA-binding MarR family transcriptional regulator
MSVVDFSRVERKRVAAERARAAFDKHDYFSAVAQVRYILRTVFRMVDEQAKEFDLEPLEHQALVQVYGSPKQGLRVTDLAERLDIAPAFASNLVKKLVARKLLQRRADATDMRVTVLKVTAAGREICHRIDAAVRPHVDYFTSQLTADERETALSTLMFYVHPHPPKTRR